MFSSKWVPANHLSCTFLERLIVESCLDAGDRGYLGKVRHSLFFNEPIKKGKISGTAGYAAGA